MVKRAFIAFSVALGLGQGALLAGVDVIYIPRGFPEVCGWSLLEDRARCPEGVTGQAEPFCRQGLRGLDAARSALGVADCQGNNMASPFLVPLAESVVQLVLLIDDSDPSGELLQSLGPTLVERDGRRLIEPSFRVFTDSLSRSRRTLVVGEQMFRTGGAEGASVPMAEWQQRIRRLLVQGGLLGEVMESAGLPGGLGETRGSTGTQASTGSQETGRDLSAPTPSGDEQQTRTEAGAGLSTPRPSDASRESGQSDESRESGASYNFEEMEIPAPFRRSFVQWRDAVGRALASEVTNLDRSRAYAIARESEGLRRLHGELLEADTPNDGEVFVPVTVMTEEGSSSIESVAIYDDEGS